MCFKAPEHAKNAFHRVCNCFSDNFGELKISKIILCIILKGLYFRSCSAKPSHEDAALEEIPQIAAKPSHEDATLEERPQIAMEIYQVEDNTLNALAREDGKSS